MSSSQYQGAVADSTMMRGWMSDIGSFLPAVSFDDLPDHFRPTTASGDENMSSPWSWPSGSSGSSSSGQSTPRSLSHFQAQHTTPRSHPSSEQAARMMSSTGQNIEFDDLDQMYGDLTSSPLDSSVFDDIDWSGQVGSDAVEEENGDDDLRCWDHGCNGRRFTTRSNLCRHKRENSAARPKYYCPRCSAIFSRAASRDVHLEKLSCGRIRRYSNGRQRPPRRKGASRRE